MRYSTRSGPLIASLERLALTLLLEPRQSAQVYARAYTWRAATPWRNFDLSSCTVL